MQLPEGLLPEELMWKVQSFLQHPTAEAMGAEIASWECKKEQAYQEFLTCHCCNPLWKEFVRKLIVTEPTFYRFMLLGRFTYHKRGCSIITTHELGNMGRHQATRANMGTGRF